MADDDPDVPEDGEDEDSLLEPSRFAKIAFARVEALTLPAASDPAHSLGNALRPGTRITRHNRTWFMGQVRSEGTSIVGRIGYQTPGTLTEIWDEEAVDFREATHPSGTTSPFAIDPLSSPWPRVAFQLRPGLIRVHSFLGAFQALLNEASPVDRWRLRQDVEEIPFDEWVKSVDRVVTLRVRLRRPNPHYEDRDAVRALVDGANARMAEIVWKADPESLDGLDVGDAFVREAIEHSKRYGSFAAAAERAGRRTIWGSNQQAAAEERVVEADPETREAAFADLRSELGDTVIEEAEEEVDGT
jgi:hypothetical protein